MTQEDVMCDEDNNPIAGPLVFQPERVRGLAKRLAQWIFQDVTDTKYDGPIGSIHSCGETIQSRPRYLFGYPVIVTTAHWADDPEYGVSLEILGKTVFEIPLVIPEAPAGYYDDDGAGDLPF